jgi:hypothetical protein
MCAIVLLAMAAASARADTAKAAEEEDEYGAEDSWEVGGSIDLSLTSDELNVTGTPSVGYFFKKDLELSLLVNFNYTRVEVETGGTASTKSVDALLEPSYHMPLREDLYLLFGLGLGGGWDGTNGEFEVVPRIGLNIVARRGSVITPAVSVPIHVGRSFGDNGSIGVEPEFHFEIGVTTTF